MAGSTFRTTDLIDLVEWIEGEVDNGGFDQFFHNYSGGEVARMIDALELIGAPRAAAITRAACARFPGGMPPTDRSTRFDLMNALWPDGDAFDEETREFQDNREDLGPLLAAFLASRSEP